MFHRGDLIGLIILCLVAHPAAAQSPASQQTIAPEGIEFNNPLISECMNLVRAGNTDEAVAKLKKQIAQAPRSDPARTGELKLGLAMIYLRTNQKVKARHLLNPMIEHAATDSVFIRAGILRQIAGRTQPFRAARQEWASTEGWTTALSNVMQDASKNLEQEHAALSVAINQYDFNAVSKHLDAAREQIDMTQFVKIPDQPVIRGAMIRKHLGALRNEITQFNSLLDSMVQQSDSMRAEPTSADYVGHRQATHRKVIQDPQARQQYDQLWDKIEKTADAGRAVAAEYHRILDENTSIYGFDHRLNIRLPARRPWHP